MTKQATINDIPVYSATISEEVDGIIRISLVDFPAVMSDFQHFAEVKPERAVALTIADEEKRLIRGVIMRADFPIYRVGTSGMEYYIIYDAATIRKMAEKYFTDHRANEVNVMHEEGSEVLGVNLVQWYIKDTAAGINPEGFEEIADGSLFAEFHVTNDQVWDSIKDGEFRGFSLEGWFSMEEATAQDEVDDIVAKLKGKFKKIAKMGNLSKIKAALAAMLCEMRSVSTDKGVIRWDGDEELKVGDKVYNGESEEGIAAADGEYIISESEVVAVVSGGEVVELRPIEAEETEEAVEEATEEVVEAAEEVTEDPKEEGIDKDVEGLRKEVNELYDIVDKILAVIGESRESIESLRQEVAELAKAPAAKSAEETFRSEVSAAERLAGSRR